MRPKLAVIATVWRPLSHTDVIVSRWLQPVATDPQFGWPVGGDEPRTQIASLYLAQRHREGRDIDIGWDKAARFEVPIYPTIREALTLGGDELAVDGVILIGEHGDYPTNQWHQKMYPRREMFDEIVAVFRESGRSVPVFNDKHFSYDLDDAHYLVDTARAMNFPLMAGSSISLAGTLEPWTLPDNAELRAGAGLFFRGADINGYHSIQWLQSLVARRAGGESGIQSVTAYVGESFERAFVDKKWSHPLMMEAINRTGKIAPARYQNAFLHLDYDAKPLPLPAAYQFEHLDGLQTTYFVCDEQPAEYTLAVEAKNGAIHGARNFVEGIKSEQFCPHFAMLCAAIENFLLGGATPYPVEHEMLCTLATRAACRALCQPEQRLETPELHIAYDLNAWDAPATTRL